MTNFKCVRRYMARGHTKTRKFLWKTWLKMKHEHRSLERWQIFWGGEEQVCLYSPGFWVSLHRSHVLPSILYIPVIPVYFGENPSILESPVLLSQINWGGDLEAGGGLFYPLGLTVGVVPRAKENIWDLKKGFVDSKLWKEPCKIKITKFSTKAKVWGPSLYPPVFEWGFWESF
jgi:hypothetical protein